MTHTHLLWLRRDLRWHDHAALASAAKENGQVQPVFVFDTDILARFSHRQDRRLSFLAATLCRMNAQLQAQGGELLVLHGSAPKIIPQLALALDAKTLHAAADFEPTTRARDKAVAETLEGQCEFKRVKDHVIMAPHEVLKADGTPYKVFTPYSKAWLAKLNDESVAVKQARQVAWQTGSAARAVAAGLKVVDVSRGPAVLLSQIGYDYVEDALWPVDAGPSMLETFASTGALSRYGDTRNDMALNGTSRLSPYLRFGLVSVREMVRAALSKPQHETWLNEIIWRDFYAMILFHFPNTPQEEFNEKYRGQKLKWSDNAAHFEAWKAGKTGYPVVDAAMRQLLQDGWMHNRARMIVASFMTKHLQLDWRWGEEHFAQYLMDYEQASNVGGWQWAASTGTDAQPYFRIFNPTTQGQKFDADGEYIRKYVPELAHLSSKQIHTPHLSARPAGYPAPIVVHEEARVKALEMFKKIA